MSSSAFPPVTPIITALSRITSASIDWRDLAQRIGYALGICLGILLYLCVLLLQLAKLFHRTLKSSIIWLRVAADMLERFDDWIERLILDNQPQPAAAPTSHNHLAQLGEDLMSKTARELRDITGIKGKRSKRSMVEQYLALV
jgi:hypothetical protein